MINTPKNMKIIDFYLTLKIKILYLIDPDRAVREVLAETTAYHEANIEPIAYHEAGHAVADYIFGIPIERATIILQNDGSPGYVEISKEWKEKFLEDRDFEKKKIYHHYFAIEKYCGGIAEAKYRGFPNKGGCRTDRSIIEIAAKSFRSEENAKKLLKIYEEDATRMMADPIIWRAVQSVALALLDKKTLSQSELKEICDKVFDRV